MPLESSAQLRLVLFRSHSSVFTMKVIHIEWAEFWDRLSTWVVFPVQVCVDSHDLITLMPFISASPAPSLPSGTNTHFPLYSTIRSCWVQNKPTPLYWILRWWVVYPLHATVTLHFAVNFLSCDGFPTCYNGHLCQEFSFITWAWVGI